MSSTLIDSAKSVFTDVLTSKFASLLGEHESNIRKGISAAVPTVLTWILHQAGHQPEATKVYDAAKHAAGNDFFGHVHELSTSQGGLSAGSALLNKGNDYATTLLGGRADNVFKEIAQYAGVSVSSASFITGVASFAALDAIGRHIAKNALDVNGMVQWLATQRDSIINAIPAGLHVKEALGLTHYPGEKVATARRTTPILIVVAILIILVAVFLFYRYHNSTATSPETNTADTVANTTNVVPAQPNGAAVTDTLPNGTVITVDKGGTEEQLIAFLNNPAEKLDKKNGNWFNFTKVNFERSSASLLLASETQLKNVVAILTAFPKADIKIGGFTDNVGDAAANVKLSQQRADNVLAKLKDLGAKHSQLDGAKGYGPANPIGDNGTEDGRALNRRMAIDVTGK